MESLAGKHDGKYHGYEEEKRTLTICSDCGHNHDGPYIVCEGCRTHFFRKQNHDLELTNSKNYSRLQDRN